MQSYAEFDEYLKHGRHQEDPGRPLANNTRVYRYRQQSIIAVRLHNTEILRYHESGEIDVNFGGWYTVTTRERIREFSPLYVYTHRLSREAEDYVWCVAAGCPWWPRGKKVHPYVISYPANGNARFHPDKRKAPTEWLSGGGQKLKRLSTLIKEREAAKQREREESKRMTRKYQEARKAARWLVRHGMLIPAAKEVQKLAGDTIGGDVFIQAALEANSVEYGVDREQRRIEL